MFSRLMPHFSRFGAGLGLKFGDYSAVADTVVDIYAATYPELAAARDKIKTEIDEEQTRFEKSRTAAARA